MSEPEYTDTDRLNALRDLLKRHGTRVGFDLTCGGSRVCELKSGATIMFADDPNSDRDDLRDALDDLIERNKGTPIVTQVERND